MSYTRRKKPEYRRLQALTVTLWQWLGKKAAPALGSGLLIIAVVGLFFATAAHASTRERTIEGIKLISDGKWEKGRAKIASTHDPLAAKIYYWLLFTEGDSAVSFDRLAQFIRHNPTWPRQQALVEKAERLMPDDASPSMVIAWFKDYPPQTAQGIDRYVAALLASGQEPEAKHILSAWWAQSPLTREEQRDLYRKYHMLIGRNAHLKRLDKVLLDDQKDNARAIANILGPGYRALCEARIALADDRADAPARLAEVPVNLQRDAGLQYERLRWRRYNDLDAEAVQILYNPPPLSQITNPEDWWKEQHILIRRMLERREYKNAYNLATKHFQNDGMPFAEAEWMAGWLALRFLDEPDKAYKHFDALYAKVTTPMSKARAGFWAALAARAMNQDGQAKEWLGKAAKYQTVYYGQMAGAALGSKQALSHAAPPALSEADHAAMQDDELIRAAVYFDAAGRTGNASRFIQAFVDQTKTPKAYRFAAEFAAGMGQYKQTIQIAKKATQEGLFLTLQAYPTMTDQIGKSNVEPALIHAIIRQESQFDVEARSPAGALGLMQLMPATAKHVAQKIGASSNVGALTQNPGYNIRLGTAYLGQLLDRYDGAYPLAIAAYNAGPSRVDSWLTTFGDPRRGDMQWLDWIEMIPVYETRNYVQRVLEGVYIYRLRLHGRQSNPANPIHLAYCPEFTRTTQN